MNTVLEKIFTQLMEIIYCLFFQSTNKLLVTSRQYPMEVVVFFSSKLKLKVRIKVNEQFFVRFVPRFPMLPWGFFPIVNGY